MSTQSSSPAQAQIQVISTSDHDFEDTSSQSSHSHISISIDSQPTSPSHSTNHTAEKLTNLTLHSSTSSYSSSSSSSSSSSEEYEDDGEDTEEETDLFQDAPPITANRAEIEQFSHLANELEIFASCIASTQTPDPIYSGPGSPSPSQSSLTTRITTLSTTSSLDNDKAPTQVLSSSSAEHQRAEAQGLIEQRKADLKRDLMELISDDEEGLNQELIMSIDRLMRDWKTVHEGLEKWRRELKGERVREMYRRERGEVE